MVGGIVTDIWRWDSNVKIIVEGTGCERQQYLKQSLQKNDNSLCIKRGDTVWWQMDMAYWTPKDKSLHDVAIPREGYADPIDGPYLEDERQRLGETAVRSKINNG